MLTADHAGLLCSRLDRKLGTHDMVRTVPRCGIYTMETSSAHFILLLVALRNLIYNYHTHLSRFFQL